jgi:hypothetical protein
VRRATARRRGAGALALAALAALALGPACSGGGDEKASDTGSSAVTTAAEPSPACRLLRTAEVSALFGSDARVTPGGAGPADVATTCLWQAQVGGDASPTLYQLQLSVYETGTLGTDSWGGTPEPVPGIGDEGFLVRKGTLGTVAGYREGDRSVVLSYGILLAPDAPDSAKQADQVVDLLRTVQRRLR